MKRMEAAVAAGQRLQLALNGQFEYLDYEDLENDVDLLIALVEEVGDVLKPVLEERARARARAD